MPSSGKRQYCCSAEMRRGGGGCSHGAALLLKGAWPNPIKHICVWAAYSLWVSRIILQPLHHFQSSGGSNLPLQVLQEDISLVANIKTLSLPRIEEVQDLPEVQLFHLSRRVCFAGLASKGLLSTEPLSQGCSAAPSGCSGVQSLQ